ncbi:hypothetical protein AVEN_210682-1, partial [Araneus ventricosus]
MWPMHNLTALHCRQARRAPYTKGDIETRTSCFMFNSIWDLPGATIRDMASTAVINLLLLTNKTDYFPHIEDQFVAMYIDFHSPMALANPFLNGFVMYPGMRYKFYIKEYSNCDKCDHDFEGIHGDKLTENKLSGGNLSDDGSF